MKNVASLNVIFLMPQLTPVLQMHILLSASCPLSLLGSLEEAGGEVGWNDDSCTQQAERHLTIQISFFKLRKLAEQTSRLLFFCLFQTSKKAISTLLQNRKQAIFYIAAVNYVILGNLFRLLYSSNLSAQILQTEYRKCFKAPWKYWRWETAGIA